MLQAFVSEPLKPLVDTVVTFGAGHFYISQSDKGGLVFGGDLDGYNSYAQRGNLPMIEDVVSAGSRCCPASSRLRLVRHWGGVMDMTHGRQPDHPQDAARELYLNGGWCYGGFKATPASGWCFAHTIANDDAACAEPRFSLDRFETRRRAGRARRRADLDLAIGADACCGSPAPGAARATTAEFPYGGDATVARPAARHRRRCGLAGLCLPARQSARAASRILAACPGLPAVAGLERDTRPTRSWRGAPAGRPGGAGRR